MKLKSSYKIFIAYIGCGMLFWQGIATAVNVNSFLLGLACGIALVSTAYFTESFFKEADDE